MNLKRFKTGALMLAVSMLAAVGIAPLANAAPSGTATSVPTNSTNDTLTITADTDLTGHTFTAVELAKIIDATAEDGKITETAVSTNSNLISNITAASKTAGAKDSDLTNDPMTWVALTLTDSDTSPYAGKLRDFVTTLSNDSTVTKAATIPLTVSGKTAVLTGEPGIYLVFDKATGATSLPILAATTINHLTNDKKTLGAVEWKSLTAPAPEKALTGINGKAPSDSHKGAVNIGDKLAYKITQQVPSTTGYAHYKLTMSDKMPKELTGPTELVVTVDGTTLTEGTGYTKTATNESDGSHTFTIILGGADNDALPVINGHKTITVAYNATVNSNARRNMSIDNTATTGYSDNPADWTHTGKVDVPTPVTLYTGGLTIRKTDRKGSPLKGAEFNILSGNTVMKFTKQADGVYTPDENGSAAIVSDDSGIIKVDGIADKQVTVKETKSPYSDSQKILPTFSTTINVDTTSGKTILDKTTESDVYGLVTASKGGESDAVMVMNVRGIGELPHTGLAGIMLMVVPFVLLLMAGVLLIVKARRK